MAIWFITGVPGSGKSLYTLQKYVIPALAKGRTVYHNIEGLEERKHLIPVFFDDIDPIHVSQNLIEIPESHIKNFYDFIAAQPREKAINALVVIDEVQNIYSARDYQSKENKSVVSYLTTHRHFGHDVIFVTQHQDNVDVAVRRMTDLSLLISNNKNFGSQKSCMVRTYNRDRIDERLPAAHVNPAVRYDKRIFCIYKSYQGKDVSEKKVAIKWWLSPKLLAIEIVLFISIVLFIKNQKTGTGFLHTGAKSGAISQSVIQTSKKEIVKDTLNNEENEVIQCAEATRIMGTSIGGELESYVNGRWLSGSYPSCR